MISIYETSLGSNVMLDRLAYTAVYYEHDNLVKELCNFVDTLGVNHIIECDNILSSNPNILIESFRPINRIISPEIQQAAKDKHIDIDIFSSGLDMGATQTKKVRDAANEYIRGNKKGMLHNLINSIGNSKAASLISRGLSRGIKDKLIKRGQSYAAKLVLKGRKNITRGSESSGEGLTDMVHAMQGPRNNPRKTKLFSMLGMVAPVLAMMPMVKQVDAVQRILKRLPINKVPKSVFTAGKRAGMANKVFGKMSKILSPKYRMASGHTRALKGGKQVALGKHLYKQFNRLKK